MNARSRSAERVSASRGWLARREARGSEILRDEFARAFFFLSPPPPPVNMYVYSRLCARGFSTPTLVGFSPYSRRVSALNTVDSLLVSDRGDLFPSGFTSPRISHLLPSLFILFQCGGWLFLGSPFAEHNTQLSIWLVFACWLFWSRIPITLCFYFFEMNRYCHWSSCSLHSNRSSSRYFIRTLASLSFNLRGLPGVTV